MKVLGAAILAASLLYLAVPPALSAEMPDNVYSPPIAEEHLGPVDKSLLDETTVCTVMFMENIPLCGVTVATDNSACAPKMRAQLERLVNSGMLISDGWLDACSAVLARPPDAST